VTPRSPAQVPLVLDGEDQAARLERFRAAHPDVPVLLLGACPRAWVGGQKIEHPTLRGLLDDLEHVFRPDTPASRPGIPR
jgi:hypothetical protein